MLSYTMNFSGNRITYQVSLGNRPMASEYMTAWIENREKLEKLQAKGEGDSKIAHQLRAQMIAWWNKMKPQQQKEIAIKYCPES